MTLKTFECVVVSRRLDWTTTWPPGNSQISIGVGVINCFKYSILDVKWFYSGKAGVKMTSQGWFEEPDWPGLSKKSVFKIDAYKFN